MRKLTGAFLPSVPARPNRGGHFVPCFSHTGEHNLPGIRTRFQHTLELPSRNDVKARSFPNECSQDPEVRVRLDGETHEVVDSTKGLVEFSERTSKLRKTVDVKRRSDLCGDLCDRDVFDTKFAASIIEASPQGFHSTITSFDGWLKEPSNRREKTR